MDAIFQRDKRTPKHKINLAHFKRYRNFLCALQLHNVMTSCLDMGSIVLSYHGGPLLPGVCVIGRYVRKRSCRKLQTMAWGALCGKPLENTFTGRGCWVACQMCNIRRFGIWLPVIIRNHTDSKNEGVCWRCNCAHEHHGNIMGHTLICCQISPTFCHNWLNSI